MTLVLIAGIAGSGKSTIALPLAEKLGAKLVDIDPFKRAVVNPAALCEGIDPPEQRWKYYELALAHAFALFEKGATHVVLDEMFHVRELRERINAACAAKGIPVRWIEVFCSDQKVHERVAQRPRGGHILNTEQLFKIREEVARAFEPFLEDDGHLALNNAGCPNESVTRALEWLRQ